jgi:RNA polymerase sigma-70 factor (ECF subfamily)
MTGSAYINLNGALTPQEEAALEDQRLLYALQTGEASAYEKLLQRYQNAVFNLAWRLLNDPSDAADVAQEVFLKVFRNLDGFRGQSSLRTWIYRIAVNEAYNRRRWLFRHRRGETALEEMFDEYENRERPLVDSTESPFDFAMNREAQALLEEGLAAVNPIFRTALVLREVDDLSYEEIAEVLEVSIGTVKSRILRGREALRGYLSGRLNSRSAVQLVPGAVK